MSTDENNKDGILPVLPEKPDSLVDVIGLSPDLMVATFEVVAPALDLQKLINSGLRAGSGGDTIFVASPSNEVRLRSIDPEGITYNDSGPPPHIGSMSPSTIWGRTKEEIRAKIERQQAVEDAMDKLVESHPLGEGGLVLANAFGGLNLDNPEETARHLVLRSAIIGEAKLQPQNYTSVGILHPLLMRLFGKEFARLMDDIGKLVDAAKMIPEESRETAGPAILAGAIAQAESFLSQHADEISEAAHIMKSPELAHNILYEYMSMQGLHRWYREYQGYTAPPSESD